MFEVVSIGMKYLMRDINFLWLICMGSIDCVIAGWMSRSCRMLCQKSDKGSERVIPLHLPNGMRLWASSAWLRRTQTENRISRKENLDIRERRTAMGKRSYLSTPDAEHVLTYSELALVNILDLRPWRQP